MGSGSSDRRRRTVARLRLHEPRSTPARRAPDRPARRPRGRRQGHDASRTRGHPGPDALIDARLPRFASPDQEARFWSRVDTVDYWDVFQETEAPLDLAPSLVRAIDQRSRSKRRVSLYLDAWTVRLARVLADREGVTPHDVFRRWVEEGIRSRRGK